MFRTAFFGSFSQLLIYFSIVLLSLIYFLYKNKSKSLFYIIVIVLFYPSIFIVLKVGNYHRIVLLVLSLYYALNKNLLSRFNKGDKVFTIFFVIYSMVFILTALLNADAILITLSQYSIYLVVYLSWFMIKREIIKLNGDFTYLNNLLYQLFLVQILMGVVKFIVFGGKTGEWLVGTMSFVGGALGTILPILGFILLWYKNDGKLKRNDWLFAIGLLFVGFITGKRAIWFIFPLVVGGYLIYIPRFKMNGKLWTALAFVPLVFYFGTRLSPSLNPEHKVWGSFDVNYIFDTADTYQFGEEQQADKFTAQGRGGATSYLFKKLLEFDTFTERDMTGTGLTGMFTTDYDEFATLGYGLNYKGAATGAYKSYVTAGYLGLFTTIMLLYSMLRTIKNGRVKLVLSLIIAWEYFYYSGTLFRTPLCMFLVCYFIFYANYNEWQKKQQRRKITQTT